MKVYYVHNYTSDEKFQENIKYFSALEKAKYFSTLEKAKNYATKLAENYGNDMVLTEEIITEYDNAIFRIEAHDKDEGGEYEEYEDETDLGNVYFNYFEVIEYEVE